ncbi:uncharacterized protein LOC121077560 [Cygnus olor]|uniref:uncharacterized protein LOC121077560 n=1 Tax=Cygnus olor TaxID=8869 RepID=UPI001ADDEAFD|nr:uncharacterized protein LOC121077560 [Cygnus olor]XP_040428778.1 uncharacterized protein LOC121077560 [Cygnus olor]XP_040428779.1 uncharacterized protein LOC121077560 [Cygnus olor]
MIPALLCASKINIAFFPQWPLCKEKKRSRRLSGALRAAEMLCLGLICSGRRGTATMACLKQRPTPRTLTGKKVPAECLTLHKNKTFLESVPSLPKHMVLFLPSFTHTQKKKGRKRQSGCSHASPAVRWAELRFCTGRHRAAARAPARSSAGCRVCTSSIGTARLAAASTEVFHLQVICSWRSRNYLGMISRGSARVWCGWGLQSRSEEEEEEGDLGDRCWAGSPFILTLSSLEARVREQDQETYLFPSILAHLLFYPRRAGLLLQRGAILRCVSKGLKLRVVHLAKDHHVHQELHEGLQSPISARAASLPVTCIVLRVQPHLSPRPPLCPTDPGMGTSGPQVMAAPIPPQILILRCWVIRDAELEEKRDLPREKGWKT